MYADGLYDTLTRDADAATRIAAPIFTKSATHAAQREYRFAILRDGTVDEKVLLTISGMMRDSLQPSPCDPPDPSKAESRVHDVHVLQQVAPDQRGRGSLSGRAPAGLRHRKGAVVGRMQELRTLEPDAAGRALGGGRDVREAIPRDPSADFVGEHRAGQAPRGTGIGANRQAVAAGVRGMEVRRSVSESRRNRRILLGSITEYDGVPGYIHKMPKPTRLALEMALHEEQGAPRTRRRTVEA